SGGLVSLTNSATISGPVNFTVDGQNKRGNSDVAAVEFHDNSSAGTASFVCQPGQVGGSGSGNIFFFDSASAGTGQFICEGAQVRDVNGGQINFENSSSAANGIFTLNAGIKYFGGIIFFNQSATADHGTFTINGGDMPAVLTFQDTADGGDA